MKTRRLFFALWPLPSMQQELAGAVGKALGALENGRMVPSGSLHLTLAFLGAVPEGSLKGLEELAAEAVRSAALPEARLEVTLDHIDYWRKAQLLCATSQHAPVAAGEFAESLKRALVAGGFTPDLKPFRPHVTLARKVLRAPHELSMARVAWSFADFALIESHTHASGSVYSVLASWTLCSGEGTS